MGIKHELQGRAITFLPRFVSICSVTCEKKIEK